MIYDIPARLVAVPGVKLTLGFLLTHWTANPSILQKREIGGFVLVLGYRSRRRGLRLRCA